jgi:hypothetical protein
MKQIILFFSILLVSPAVAQQTNYHFSHSDSTTATSGKIWQIWTDVPNWKQWDKGLKEAYLEADFSVGAKGKLMPDKGPKSKFFISELTPNKSYTFKIKIPFGWLIVNRTLEAKDGMTYFTHDVQFTGLLKKALGKKIGKNYRTMLPGVLNEIKLIAERK